MLDISCKLTLNKNMKQLEEEEAPTYEEYIKDMSLAEQIKFYYDVDIDNYLGDPWEILAECAVDPHWLKEFKVNFKEYLQEREYIR